MIVQFKDFVPPVREKQPFNNEVLYFHPINIYRKNSEIIFVGITGQGKKITCHWDFSDQIYIDVLETHAEFLNNAIKITKQENIKLWRIDKFQTEQSNWVRFYFKTCYDRYLAIKELRSHKNIVMSNTELKYEYNIIRTMNINCAGWNVISKYEHQTVLGKTEIFIKPDSNGQCSMKATDFIPDERILVQTWDIETYSYTGAFPEASRINSKEVLYGRIEGKWEIFMICACYAWASRMQPFQNICFVRAKDIKYRCEFHPDITVLCNTEKEVVQAFLMTFKAMNPDICYAFNGACFDWKLVQCVINEHKDLKALVSEICGYDADKCFTSRSIKIDAMTNHACNVVLSSKYCLDVDVMPTFMRLYPRAEVGYKHSLNKYLELNGLSGKADMDYNYMFAIYRQVLKENYDQLVEKSPQNYAEYTTVELLGEVAHYCAVDCLRTHELCVKRAVFSEAREIANLSCVSLEDVFYGANTAKIHNIIGKYAHRLGYAFDNVYVKSDSKTRYPGGKVFPPICGLHNDVPIAGLDFASLYPSTMMQYNISTDRLVESEEQAVELEKAGYKINRIGPITITDTDSREITVRFVSHRGVVDAGDRIVEKWQKRTVWSWKKDVQCVKTDNLEITPTGAVFCGDIGEELPQQLRDIVSKGDKRRSEYVAVRGRSALPAESMGILALVVKELFDARQPLKRKYVELVSKMEVLEAQGERDEALSYRISVINSKQLALKVMANTVYGTMGFTASPIYNINTAAGVTKAGQDSINLVHRFVKDLGFTPYYGDTDSVYAGCPARLFQDLVERCVDPRQLMHEKVLRSIEVFNDLTERINDHLVKVTGGVNLRVAYEEVGFPTVFCGKKKYFMQPHKETVNFNTESMMMRGIDVVKQSQAKIVRTLGFRVMHQALDIDNRMDLMEIIFDIIRRYVDGEWTDLEEFKINSRYRADKKNVKVNTFVGRMKKICEEMRCRGEDADMFEPPESGDRFDYVIVKKEARFDRMSLVDVNKTIGSKMEYFRVVKERPGEYVVDKDYYMENMLVGMFARFICHMPYGNCVSEDKRVEEAKKKLCRYYYDVLNEQELSNEKYREYDNLRFNTAKNILREYYWNLLKEEVVCGGGSVKRSDVKKQNGEIWRYVCRRFDLVETDCDLNDGLTNIFGGNDVPVIVWTSRFESRIKKFMEESMPRRFVFESSDAIFAAENVESFKMMTEPDDTQIRHVIESEGGDDVERLNAELARMIERAARGMRNEERIREMAAKIRMRGNTRCVLVKEAVSEWYNSWCVMNKLKDETERIFNEYRDRCIEIDERCFKVPEISDADAQMVKNMIKYRLTYEKNYRKIKVYEWLDREWYCS